MFGYTSKHVCESCGAVHWYRPASCRRCGHGVLRELPAASRERRVERRELERAAQRAAQRAETAAGQRLLFD